jgi:hypothetical protein
MALLAVNSGLRESNVSGLQWTWEVTVEEVGRSVFVIPPEAFNAKPAHVVILNDVAWSIIETQRGKHPTWVFPRIGKPVSSMNDTAWQRPAAWPRLATFSRLTICRQLMTCKLRRGISSRTCTLVRVALP